MLRSLTPTEALGLTIIGEARGERIEGQVAVGCVCRNRLQSGKYKSYNEVVFAPKQFSCWNPNDPNHEFLLELAEKLLSGSVLNDAYLRQCMYVAAGIIDWHIMDNTKGAQHYMTIKLFDSDDRPKWANQPREMLIIGNQAFFSIRA